MTHLTADELIDAMDGTLAPQRHAHLASCDECRVQFNDLANVLQDAKQVSVPEPSPLFWSHFSQRVRIAIDREPGSGAGWPGWLRWQVLLPLGAVAIIILGLVMTIPIEIDHPDISAVEDAPPLEFFMVEGWSAVEELVGSMDIETASAAGVIEPGVAELAMLELTAEEQQELTRLLQAELTRAKS